MSAGAEMIIVGDLSKDFTVIDGERETGVGGGVYFAGFAAKPAGIEYLTLVKVAEPDIALLDELRRFRIPVVNVPTPQTTTMTDIFESSRGYERRSEVEAAASAFELPDIPFHGPCLIYFTPMMRGVVPELLIEELARRGTVAIDIQGFLRVLEGRSLEYRPWPAAARLLKIVTYLKTDRREALLLTGETETNQAIRRILKLGAKELVMTDDRKVIATDGSTIAEEQFGVYDIRSRSGRGDTCFSAYLSYRLHHDIKDSLAYAAEITNQKLKAPGPYRS